MNALNQIADSQVSYFARREAQERALAERASDPCVKRIHDDLAARYAALADTVAPNG